MKTPSGSDAGDVPSAAHHGPVSHAIFRMGRLYRVLAGQLMREVGLHPSQEPVMRTLWERGSLRLVDLGELTGSDAATTTRTVQRLERAGLVRRVPSDTDKRSVIVEPTAASLALRGKVECIRSDLEHRLTDGLGEAAQAEMLVVLERLERNLTQHVGNATCPACADEPCD
ncbi:MarR family winged helix-turn-helix transcriptional regulator [Streptomyces sp. NPDC096311]|uniref:MarR family winged helix-turn-helix transcriptional regulator n=1 Tax=Streptomyces sp. NPDC096311 TaxID=3366083 RepID=UPI00380EDDF2